MLWSILKLKDSSRLTPEIRCDVTDCEHPRNGEKWSDHSGCEELLRLNKLLFYLICLCQLHYISIVVRNLRQMWNTIQISPDKRNKDSKSPDSAQSYRPVGRYHCRMRSLCRSFLAQNPKVYYVLAAVIVMTGAIIMSNPSLHFTSQRSESPRKMRRRNLRDEIPWGKSHN